MDGQVNKDNTDNFRSTLAQIVAALAVGCATFCNGFTLVASTIIIGALKNDSSTLGMSETTTSWFGSVMYVVQPVGSAIAALLLDVLGRKTCLMLVNLPHLLAWTIIYFSSSQVELFIAIMLLGMALGFSAAAVVIYLGEIAQPNIRSVLMTVTSVFANTGVMALSFLATVLDWHTLALYCTAAPVIAFLAFIFVPDSPASLARRGKIKEAEKSYQWLRGWVEREDVKNELTAMVDYIKETQDVKKMGSLEYTAVPTKESPEVNKRRQWLHLLLEPTVRKSFEIVFIYLALMTSVSLMAMRPFFIDILKTINSPVRPYVVLAICSALQLLGTLCGGVIIKILGKRKVTFISLGLCIFCCLALGAYLSFNPDLAWIPVALFCLSYFAVPLGVYLIPWILISELFPLRARGMASGISIAFVYTIYFVTTKTYYSLVSLVDVSGTCYFYGAIGVLGYIYLYWNLPETEGVSLEEIERQLREGRHSKQHQGPRHQYNTESDINMKAT